MGLKHLGQDGMRVTGLGVVVGMAVCFSAAAQYSIWLPEAEKFVFTPAFTYQTFNKFWAGRDKVEMDGDLWQNTALMTLEYGVTDDLVVDTTMGRVWSETDSSTLGVPPGGDNLNDDGLTDTTVGIRRRFINQANYDYWWL